MPKSHRQTAEAHSGPEVPTFEEAASQVLAILAQHLRPSSLRDLQSVLQTYVLPHIGTVPISELTLRDVLEVLRPIWEEKPAQARKVKSLIHRVLAWACASGFRPDTLRIEAVAWALPRQPRPAGYRAVPHSEVPSVLTSVRGSRASPLTKCAFEFLLLTMARSGEACAARWEEMDLTGRVWTVPADRRRSPREFGVPLPDEAFAVLANARELGNGEGPVFPNRRGGPLSASSLSALLRRLGINAVPHSFRASFREWCAQTGVSRDLAELSLGRVCTEPFVRAVCRSEFLSQRREIMEAWGAYVCGHASSR